MVSWFPRRSLTKKQPNSLQLTTPNPKVKRFLNCLQTNYQRSRAQEKPTIKDKNLKNLLFRQQRQICINWISLNNSIRISAFYHLNSNLIKLINSIFSLGKGRSPSTQSTHDSTRANCSNTPISNRKICKLNFWRMLAAIISKITWNRLIKTIHPLHL